MSATGLYMRGSGREVTDWDLIRAHIFRRDDWTCYVCGQPASQVDHVWPRRHGGTDHVDNLKAICQKCNQRKGDRVDIQDASIAQIRDAIRARIKRIESELRGLDRFVEELTARSDNTMDLFGASTELRSVNHDIANRITAMRAEMTPSTPINAEAATGT